jgi:uncharacterized protein YllA (UPF0747 family)
MLVKDFSWLDVKRLGSAPEVLNSLFTEYYAGFGMLRQYEARIEKLAEYMAKRVKALEQAANLSGPRFTGRR